MAKPIDTAFLDELKDESDNIAAQNRFTKLTLAQGEDAIIRILPANLAGKRFYGKIAKHWVNKTSIICPKKTDKAYGGDPEADCACCDFCEGHRNHARVEVADRAYDSISKPNYVMFVRVHESTSRSFRKEAKDVAHEFTTWGSAMDDLLSIYRRKAEKGVYLDDPVDGFDLHVRRGKRGTEINLDDQTELYTNDAGGKRLKAILSTISFKHPEMPAEADLEKFATKVEDYCFSGGSSSRDSRGRDSDSRDSRGRDSDSRGSRDSRDSRDSRGRADDGEPDENESTGRSSRSSRRDDVSTDNEAPARSRRSDPDDSHVNREPRRSRSESDDDEIPGLTTPPPNRAVSAPPAARRSSEPESVRTQEDRPSRQPAHHHDDPEEDDTAAEERRDAIPPRQAADEESPSEESVPAPRPPSRLKDRLSKTIGHTQQ